MDTESDALPAEALDDVAYLARSANRVAILRALTDGPHTRREVQAATDTSRTTLDRIVNELEDRGWAERTVDGDYVATPTGEHLVREFLPLVRSVEAIRRLDEAVDWLPTDDLSIGLEPFRDAVVRRPESDPTEIIDYFVDLVRGSSEFRALSDMVPPTPIARCIHERATADALRVAVVSTPEVLSYLRDRSDRRTRWAEVMQSGGDTYCYDGSVPCNVWVVDGTVLIKKSDDSAIPESYGLPIVSRNEAALSWAIGLIDRYQAEATRVDPAVFGEERSASPSDSD